MKQTLRAVKRPVQAHIVIPGSKSITNRALLLAALAQGVSQLQNILLSDDTVACIAALRELGIDIQLNEAKRSCVVTGSGGIFPKKEANIACCDAGTVARFLLAACASSPGVYHFDGSPRLRERPIELLLKMLVRQGVVVNPPQTTQMPFIIQGNQGLKGGEITMDGSETGQFISALLMVAPLAKNQMLIKVENLVSAPYVEMTRIMMSEFGVLVRRLPGSHFSIPVPQRYVAREYSVEPDLSTASYFFAAAALTQGTVTIPSIDREKSKQGDIAFLSVLEKMGCQVINHADEIAVTGPAELQGTQVDMRDFSDTFMTLSAIAPFAKTPTTITNIGHTRLQESDRLTVMHTQLEKLNVKVESGPDWIKIYPSEPRPAVIESHHDHRIAMAFSVMGLRVSDIVIENAECVAKTCPEFFTLWEHLY